MMDNGWKVNPMVLANFSSMMDPTISVVSTKASCMDKEDSFPVPNSIIKDKSDTMWHKAKEFV